MLNPNSEGASGFKRTFYKEYNLFERSTRDLANAYANYGLTAKDYIGMYAIGSGTAVTIATGAALASFGIITSIFSVGIGLAAALIGIGAAAGFVYYRNNVKKQKCIDAVDFIASTSMLGKIDAISDRIANQFSDYLNHCSDQQAYEFARKAHAIMAAAIMEREVKTPMELVKPEYMLKYQKLIPIFNPAPKPNIFARLKQNMVAAWCGKKNQEKVNVTVTSVGHFRPQRLTQRRGTLLGRTVNSTGITETTRPRLGVSI